MRRIVLLAAALGAVFIGLRSRVEVSVGVPEAAAADKWQYNLTSTDAGSTNTGALTKQREYAIQCDIPCCYKTGTSTPLSADCTKDFVVAGQSPSVPGSAQPGRDFDSASDSYVVARAVDGGNPNARVLLRTRTP